MFRLGKSIKWKLLTAFVGIVVVVILVMLFSISRLVENRIIEDINENFTEVARVFDRVQDIRFRQMRQSGILLAEVPQLKAAVSTGDTATVNQLLREDILFLLDFDPIIPDTLVPDAFYDEPESSGLLLVTDDAGMPIGQISRGSLSQFSIADRSGVSEALQGRIPDQTYIWEQGGEYFNVMSMPIFSGGMILGTLSHGFPIRQLETEQLSRDIGMEISYFIDNHLSATSFTGLSDDLMDHLGRQIHQATFEVTQKGEAHSMEINLGTESWLVYVAPMHAQAGSRGISGYYAVAKSLTAALQPLRNIQMIIFILGVLSVIAAVMTSFWITTRITSPIQRLVEGVQRVENEDFSKEVPVTTKDELGRLTEAFNELSKGIRERLLMLKFVSRATLDAIKNNLSRIEPGGERRDVTVLFSDIRGFTSWSELRSPEEVIEMLNRLFSFQTEVVNRYGGDVDKFVGDELVAVFQGEEKERNAVEAAMEIQRSIRQVIPEKEEISVGIGIHTGEVVMGAMGSADRMDYTVLGNEVNLGARLCSSAGAEQILISGPVYLCLERRIFVEELEPIEMKGFSEPVTLYEVDWKSSKVPEKMQNESKEETP